MEALFLKLLNMSITAGWIVLAVVLLRLLLKKAPKWISCLLWVLVGLRLILPFSFESKVSVVPSTETVPQEIIYSQAPTINSGVPFVNNSVNPVISESLAPEVGASVNPIQIVIFVATIVWCIGMAGMLIYALISYLRVKHKVRISAPLRENIYICDNIGTPFILGVFKPKIYLPSELPEREAEYVIAHEKSHLKRRDHLWKPIGFALLTVYWFNPLLWLGYVLLCRDIELACDERVIKNMDAEEKKAYSTALLDCSIPRRMISACPLAFGEVDVKNRIKSVLNYKKPAFWIIVVAIIACIVAAVCLLTDPKREKSTDDPFGCIYEVVETTYVAGKYSGKADSFGRINYYISPDGQFMQSSSYYNEWCVRDNLKEVELTYSNFDVYFNNNSDSSLYIDSDARSLRRNNARAWIAKCERASMPEFFYVLLQNDGSVYVVYGTYEIGDTNYCAKGFYKLSAISNAPIPISNTSSEHYPNNPILLYTCKESPDPMHPMVYFYESNDWTYFTFMYSGFCEQISSGSYTQSGDIITLTDSENGLTYTFKLTDKGFVFDAENSSEIPAIEYDGKSWTTLKNGDVFTFDEEYQPYFGVYTNEYGSEMADIDNDGTEELCMMGYGWTSGLHTISLSVWENGSVEYAIWMYADSLYDPQQETTVNVDLDEFTFVSDENGSLGVTACKYAFENGEMIENGTMDFDIRIDNGYIVLVDKEQGLLLSNSYYYDGTKDESISATSSDTTIGTNEKYLEGVSISVKEQKLYSGIPYIEIEWTNTTDECMIFRDAFTLYYKDGDEWVDSSTAEISYGTTRYALPPNDTVRRKYYLSYNDLSKNEYLFSAEYFPSESPSEIYTASVYFDIEDPVDPAETADYQASSVIYASSLLSSPDELGVGTMYRAVMGDGGITLYRLNSVNEYDSVGVLKPTELTKENFDGLFSDGFKKSSVSAESLRQQNSRAFMLTGEENELYILLFQNDGSVYLVTGNINEKNKALSYATRVFELTTPAMLSYGDVVSGEEESSVYKFYDSIDVIEPEITLYGNGEFQFIYSGLSSYIGWGSYILTEDTLTLPTSDGMYVYVFDVTSEGFRFDAERSSELQKFRYHPDEEAQTPVPDGALFEGIDAGFSKYSDSEIIASGDYYTVTDMGNYTYEYEIVSRTGNILLEDYGLTKEPKIKMITDSVVRRDISGGTGMLCLNTVYCDVRTEKVSENFTGVWGEYDNKVLYVTYEDGGHNIVIQDFFDKSVYYKKIPITKEFIATEVVTSVDISEDGIATILYFSDSDYNQSVIRIDLTAAEDDLTYSVVPIDFDMDGHIYIWDSGKYHTSLTSHDSGYDYVIQDINGNVVLEDHDMNRWPNFHMVNDSILRMYVQYGTGLLTRNTVYVNVKTGEISPTYGCAFGDDIIGAVYGEYGNNVVYLTLENDCHYMVVRDIFDEKKFYKKVLLTDDKNAPIENICSWDISPDGIATFAFIADGDLTEETIKIDMTK